MAMTSKDCIHCKINKSFKSCLKDDNVGADMQLQGNELKTNGALRLKLYVNKRI